MHYNYVLQAALVFGGVVLTFFLFRKATIVSLAVVDEQWTCTVDANDGRVIAANYDGRIITKNRFRLRIVEVIEARFLTLPMCALKLNHLGTLHLFV